MKAKDSAPPKASLVLDGIPKMVTLWRLFKASTCKKDHLWKIYFTLIYSDLQKSYATWGPNKPIVSVQDEGLFVLSRKNLSANGMSSFSLR